MCCTSKDEVNILSDSFSSEPAHVLNLLGKACCQGYRAVYLFWVGCKTQDVFRWWFHLTLSLLSSKWCQRHWQTFKSNTVSQLLSTVLKSMNGVSRNAHICFTDCFLYFPVKEIERIILKHISPTDSWFAVNRTVAATITVLVDFVNPYSEKLQKTEWFTNLVVCACGAGISELRVFSQSTHFGVSTWLGCARHLAQKWDWKFLWMKEITNESSDHLYWGDDNGQPS